MIYMINKIRFEMEPFISKILIIRIILIILFRFRISIKILASCLILSSYFFVSSVVRSGNSFHKSVLHLRAVMVYTSA